LLARKEITSLADTKQERNEFDLKDLNNQCNLTFYFIYVII